MASITMEVGKHIESTGYEEGVAGFRIDGDGNAEFNNARFRGTVEAGSVIAADEFTAANAEFSGSVTVDVDLRINDSGDQVVLAQSGDVLYIDVPKSGSIPVTLGNYRSVTGSRGGNAALASLLAALAADGIIKDDTTA